MNDDIVCLPLEYTSIHDETKEATVASKSDNNNQFVSRDSFKNAPPDYLRAKKSNVMLFHGSTRDDRYYWPCSSLGRIIIKS
jgi:hypothetical protein